MHYSQGHLAVKKPQYELSKFRVGAKKKKVFILFLSYHSCFGVWLFFIFAGWLLVLCRCGQSIVGRGARECGYSGDALGNPSRGSG